MRILFLRLRHVWAVLTGRELHALTLLSEIAMADLSALSAAIDRVVAKSAADAQALADAQSANANLQPEIDALTAKLDALAPAPAAADPAPATDPAAPAA